ncbi:MAG TPA: cation:proton antiporter [Candidatus Nanopelagicales bacterium]|nr:cation:proton antiporter [Candidatus Nanopelagicales bacterium]
MDETLLSYAVTGVVALGVAVFIRQRGWGIALPLIALGALVGVAPVGPSAPPNPEVILIVILAPLVFGEALGSSYLDLRKVSRPVLALAIGLVVSATVVVGGVVSAAVAIPITVALALGAILAPTDAVAVSTIAKRASIPRRLVSILEGESLVNDGTGLTALRVTVMATVAGSVTFIDATGMFAVAVTVGLAVGAAFGWGMSLILTRSRDLVAANSLIVIAPFSIYLVAEELDGSGILAVVVAALWVAASQHSDPGWSGRLSGNTVWKHLTFILQVFAFLLIGLELPASADRLDTEQWNLVLILVPLVLFTLIITRALFVAIMVVAERARDRRRSRRTGVDQRRKGLGRESAVLAWAGARGPVSGLAAFSLPLTTTAGDAFPYRDVLLATTFVIIVISLLLALTVAPFARWLKVGGDDDVELTRTMDTALARAALDRLNAAIEEAENDDNPIPQEVVDRLQQDAQTRLENVRGIEDPSITREMATRRMFELARAMVRAEQEELLRLRDEEGFPDAIVRRRLQDLDLRQQALGAER